MRLCLLNQFYPPDPAPTGQFLHDVARALVERGHQVRVVASRRGYGGAASFPPREVRDGVDVIRVPAFGFGTGTLPGKIADYVSYLAGAVWEAVVRRPRPDMVLALTTPPFLGWAARLSADLRGCRRGHWIMDAYPDVMVAHGMVPEGGAAHRALAALARAELSGSQLTLALGPWMARRLEAHAGRPVPWVPLWGHPGAPPWPQDRAVPLRIERGWREGELVFMYSGNMGLGHRFVEFLEAARRLGPGGPRWAFCGGGRRRADVQAFAKANPGTPIELHPHVPQQRLSEALAAGDVHLVSLEPAWQGTMVPSKIMGIFAAKRPVIFLGGRHNEVADWVDGSGRPDTGPGGLSDSTADLVKRGWVIEPGDVEGMLAAIAEARSPAERARRGAAARRFSEKYFDALTNIGRICDMLEGACAC